VSPAACPRVRQTALLFACVLLAACGNRGSGRILSAGGPIAQDWDGAIHGGSLTVKTLGTNANMSRHLIKLQGTEKLHVHERHDVTIFVLEGTGHIRLGEREFDFGPGDVLEIPRGMPHRAESLHGKPVVVYAIFTPPSDGVDYREVIL
jgi:mannose-6-phosphate isomerase-like protein (cupin superfamily)